MVAVKFDALILFGLLNHKVTLRRVYTLHPSMAFLSQVCVSFMHTYDIAAAGLSSRDPFSTLLGRFHLVL